MAGRFHLRTSVPSYLSLTTERSRNAARRAGSFGYGFVAQCFSAGTNFGLVVLAAHVLGPAGLGIVSVGFAAYLVLLGFQRGLLNNPLVASSAADDQVERRATALAGVELAIVATLLAAVVLAGIGLVLPAQLGRGILLFAPWLVAALVQDLGRSILFRDGKGKQAALADAAWFFVMIALAPVALATKTEWAVSGCWGLGATAGAAVALAQIRWRPVPLGSALSWWRSEAWPLGRWLLLGGTLYNAATYASVLSLAGILGAHAYGGLRAVQSIFAPLTLIGPALALPGLPLMSRRASDSPRRALRIAWQLAGVAAFATTGYLVILYSFPGVLSFVFGSDFVEFRSLMIPIGIAQLLAVPGAAFSLFLMAQQRGRSLVWIATLTVFSVMVSSITLALLFGVEGAAWGAAAGAAVGALCWAVVLLRPHQPWSGLADEPGASLAE